MAKRIISSAFFDLDGTIKKEPNPWRYLHKKLGVEERAKDFRNQYARGEIDYTTWCELDVQLWTGQRVERVRKLLRAIPYFPNTREVIAELRKRGTRLFLISNGLNLHAEQVKEDLGFEYAISNELISQNGILTGEVKVNVPFDGKGRIVVKILSDKGLKAEHCMAVGNDESDIPMFKIAGLAIAIKPTSDRVGLAADVVIKEADLSKILPYVLSRC